MNLLKQKSFINQGGASLFGQKSDQQQQQQSSPAINLFSSSKPGNAQPTSLFPQKSSPLKKPLSLFSRTQSRSTQPSSTQSSLFQSKTSASPQSLFSSTQPNSSNLFSSSASPSKTSLFSNSGSSYNPMASSNPNKINLFSTKQPQTQHPLQAYQTQSTVNNHTNFEEQKQKNFLNAFSKIQDVLGIKKKGDGYNEAHIMMQNIENKLNDQNYDPVANLGALKDLQFNDLSPQLNLKLRSMFYQMNQSLNDLNSIRNTTFNYEKTISNLTSEIKKAWQLMSDIEQQSKQFQLEFRLAQNNIENSAKGTDQIGLSLLAGNNMSCSSQISNRLIIDVLEKLSRDLKLNRIEARNLLKLIQYFSAINLDSMQNSEESMSALDELNNEKLKQARALRNKMSIMLKERSIQDNQKKGGKMNLRSVLSFNKSSKETNFMGFNSTQGNGYKNFLKNIEEEDADAQLLETKSYRKGKNWVPAAIRKIIEKQNKKIRANDDHDKIEHQWEDV